MSFASSSTTNSGFDSWPRRVAQVPDCSCVWSPLVSTGEEGGATLVLTFIFWCGTKIVHFFI